jgi:hypothetical protein
MDNSPFNDGSGYDPFEQDIAPEGTWEDETAPSALTVDYYRQKAQQFQAVLILLDQTGRDLYDAGTQVYASGDSEAIAEYESLQAEYDSKRDTFRNIAEGINFASQNINAAGIEFPTVQIPFGLGGIGIAPLVAAAGIIAGAAWAISWATGFWRTVAAAVARWQHLSAIMALPEGERATALEVFQRTEKNAETAIATANESPLTALSNLAKWAAIGVLGYVAYRAISNKGN